MSISVSMITLNEEDYIARALDSCRFASEIVVVDGGSEDNTLSILDGYDNLKYEVFQWNNNFGRQRQNSLNMVSPDCDWWMRLDADERYSELFVDVIESVLGSLSEDILCVRIRQVNLYQDEFHYSANRGGWETWPRVFRNLRTPDGKSAWFWDGAVHEYPKLITRDGVIEPLSGIVANLNVPVIHYGWLDKSRRQNREDLYTQIPGSNFQPGSILNRNHKIRRIVNK